MEVSIDSPTASPDIERAGGCRCLQHERHLVGYWQGSPPAAVVAEMQKHGLSWSSSAGVSQALVRFFCPTCGRSQYMIETD